MFKKALEQKLKTIFGVTKVSFDMPAEDAEELDVMFIRVTNVTSKVTKGVETARVTGTFSIAGASNKVPFGFFSKKIYKASPEDTKEFFFYNFDDNEKIIGNVIEMNCSFIYFYNSQYDPSVGQMNEVALSITEGLNE